MAAVRPRLRFGFTMGSRPAPKPFHVEAVVLKRGGGTAPNTADPSTLPTTPPASSYKHGTPKINGSEGGFIGLIVGLAVFILLCCGAIFYLLRARPKRQGTKDKSPRGFAVGFFSSRRKRNAGWMQQNNEFNYDSGEDDDLHNHPSARYAEGGKGYSGRESHDQREGYADPFDPEKLPESVLRQQVPLKPLQNTTRIPVSDPRPSNSVERQASGVGDVTPKQSPTSPTFEGGTKFKEQF